MTQGKEAGGYTNSDASARGIITFTVLLTPAATNTVTAVEQSFAVPTGCILANDVVLSCEKAASQSGLGFGAYRNAGGGTPLAIQFWNPTAGNITSTAGEAWRVTVLRA